MPAPVLVFTDPAMVDHDPTHGERAAHPEQPDRLRVLLELIDEPSLAALIETRQPRPATRDDLLAVHTPRHVDRLLALDGHTQAIDPDTSVTPGSIHAAKLAAGALLDAVEAVFADAERRRAMCLVRPPGHHAEPDRAMGFCLFGNVALAAAAARARELAQRVLIVDWDVHHGNGTQAAFYERSDVLCVDIHQHPLYPGTGHVRERGRGDGLGFTVNCPVPAGFADAEVLALADRLLPELADRFRPDLVLVSAGFDAHVDDPLGGLAYTTAGFAQLCARVRDIADRHAGGRLILSLEGGYDLTALRDSVRACVEILAGGEAPPIAGQPGARSLAFIEQLVAAVAER